MSTRLGHSNESLKCHISRWYYPIQGILNRKTTILVQSGKIPVWIADERLDVHLTSRLTIYCPYFWFPVDGIKESVLIPDVPTSQVYEWGWPPCRVLFTPQRNRRPRHLRPFSFHTQYSRPWHCPKKRGQKIKSTEGGEHHGHRYIRVADETETVDVFPDRSPPPRTSTTDLFLDRGSLS